MFSTLFFCIFSPMFSWNSMLFVKKTSWNFNRAAYSLSSAHNFMHLRVPAREIFFLTMLVETLFFHSRSNRYWDRNKQITGGKLHTILEKNDLAVFDLTTWGIIYRYINISGYFRKIQNNYRKLLPSKSHSIGFLYLDYKSEPQCRETCQTVAHLLTAQIWFIWNG